jgi:hypothetical protein
MIAAAPTAAASIFGWRPLSKDPRERVKEIELGVTDRNKAIVHELRGSDVLAHLAAASELERLRARLREVRVGRDYCRDLRRSEMATCGTGCSAPFTLSCGLGRRWKC